MATADETFLEHKREFSDFLNQDHRHNDYIEKISKMVQEGRTRFIVNIDDVRRFNADLATGTIEHPLDYLAPFEDALYEQVAFHHPSIGKEGKKNLYKIGFEGNLGGSHQVSPRALLANLLGTLVRVEGVVTKCSLVRPKLVKSVHFCEKTQKVVSREYRDHTSISGQPTPMSYPTRDDDGNVLITEYGLCEYKNHQVISLQERTDRAPPGQLPRSVEIIVEDDLVDKCKPGDMVHCLGVYKAISPRSDPSSVRTILIANNLIVINKEVRQPKVTEDDRTRITKLARRADILDLLGRSVAPWIYGHEEIKKAVILLMAGGVEKTLENHTHLRGDINILLIGDPSTAKSQMLRFVLNVAPLAINTTGRGSSGVGLTAAVTQDSETGERRLEAGAMVLADRGIVCIDEFDKMSEDDRVAIHEVMEQQTVTIAKAGLHVSLNARCSVLAAANPVYGHYDPHLPPLKNIALPDSLLSRFDLLFVVQDETSKEKDDRIASHVLQMHQYRPKHGPADPALAESFAEVLAQDESFLREEEERNDYIKLRGAGSKPPPSHGRTMRKGANDKLEFLPVSLVKKYLSVSKELKPVLTDTARARLVEEYTALRHEDKARTLPITARTLEALIRLSTAHAKIRLHTVVEEDDVESAVSIMRYAMYREVIEKKKRKSEEVHSESDSDNEGTSDERTKRRKSKHSAAGDASPASSSAKSRDASASPAAAPAPATPSASSSTTPTRRSTRTVDLNEPGPSRGTAGTGSASPAAPAGPKVTQDEVKQVLDVLNQLAMQTKLEEFEVDTCLLRANSSGSTKFTSAHFLAVLRELSDQNTLMLLNNDTALRLV